MDEPLKPSPPDVGIGVSGFSTIERLVPTSAPPTGSEGPTTDEHGMSGETRGQIRITLSRFRRQRLAMGSLIVFFILALAAVLTGHFWKYGFTQITGQYATGPSLAHPFGTDDIGHDLFSQTMRGTEKDIQTALLVAALSMVVGTFIGAIAGYYRGWADNVLMRLVDLVLSIPILAVLIVLANIVSKLAGNWFWIAIIIAATSWTYVARLVRADFLSLRERDFVEATRALGATDRRIISRHMLPNAVGPIIVNATITVAASIVLESTLSFLGLGIQPPDVSLGELVAAGSSSATTEWWLFVFPAIFLIVLIMCIFLVGDGLREAFDPKKSRVRA
jgi:peptide/nickel transport system permease protein